MSAMAVLCQRGKTEGWELVPTIWCPASPPAHVTKMPMSRVARPSSDGIKAAGAIDGVLFSICMARWSQNISTTAKENPSRVRQAIARTCHWVSLDLHANVTPEMVEHADALIAYGTYPLSTWPTPDAPPQNTSRCCCARSGASPKRSGNCVPDFRSAGNAPTSSRQGHYQKLAALQSDAVADAVRSRGFPAADSRLRRDRIRLWPHPRCRRRG